MLPNQFYALLVGRVDENEVDRRRKTDTEMLDPVFQILVFLKAHLWCWWLYLQKISNENVLQAHFEPLVPNASQFLKLIIVKHRMR